VNGSVQSQFLHSLGIKLGHQNLALQASCCTVRASGKWFALSGCVCCMGLMGLFSLLQYPGWSQMEDGSIRVSEVTEDSLGTYTCVPYNSLGTMGQSPPAPLVLKVENYTCSIFFFFTFY